jgi:hypothetical protein
MVSKGVTARERGRLRERLRRVERPGTFFLLRQSATFCDIGEVIGHNFIQPDKSGQNRTSWLVRL